MTDQALNYNRDIIRQVCGLNFSRDKTRQVISIHLLIAFGDSYSVSIAGVRYQIVGRMF